jgi:hypothetical protein
MTIRPRLDRLERLEARSHRRMAAEAGAARGFTADQILDEAIRWLSLPPEEQAAVCPHFTPEEMCIMRSWLPGIRRARMLGAWYVRESCPRI